MNPPRRQVALAVGLALAMLAAGCERSDRPDQDQPAGPGRADRQSSTADSADAAIPDRPTGQQTDSSVQALARRVAAFVDDAVRQDRQRLLRCGLAPADRIQIVLSFDPAGEEPRRALMNQRVSEALVQAVCEVEGVMLWHGPPPGGAWTLHAAVTTDFRSPFDCISCVFTLQPAGADGQQRAQDRRQITGRFDSEAVARVLADGDGPVVVHLARANGPAVQFEVPPGQWFSIHRGPYTRIEVRSGDRLWRLADGTLALQNLWDIRGPAGPLPAQADIASPARLEPPVPEPPLAPPDEPTLTITSPMQVVGRTCSVAGEARGLDSASVHIFVIDIDGEGVRYQQDGLGTVRGGQWVVPQCYFGRDGAIDRGKRFQIVASARLADGRSVQSQGVVVVRE